MVGTAAVFIESKKFAPQPFEKVQEAFKLQDEEDIYIKDQDGERTISGEAYLSENRESMID